MTHAFNTGGAEGQSAGQNAGMHIASSFGVAHTTFGPTQMGGGFRANGFISSTRVKTLARRESYFKCTHHDFKMFDFDGRMIPPGPPTSQPMLSAEQFAHYVPLKMRRPASPYRLARAIVNSFTSLLLGHGRWPTIRVHGDPETEYFFKSIEKEGKLRTLFIRARSIGGSVGSVGISWRFFEGKPRFSVHSGKHIHIHEWCDREALIPAHVSEIYTFSEERWNEQKKRMDLVWMWFRRDWTENSDIMFKPVEYKRNEDPQFEIDEDNTIMHNDGVCHFVWIQNLPEGDDTEIDGQPDYAELYEDLEEIDIVKSVVTRGAKLNLDPTLVLKMDPDILARMGVQKGSDNALVVGTGGDAKYMELSGTSINVGIELVTKLREAILETAQCVIADPNEVGGAGTSSVALKIIYEPMIAKTDLLREQYGDALKRLLQSMFSVVKKYMEADPEYVPVLDDEQQPVLDDAGEQVFDEVIAAIDLPPRVVTERVDVENDDGEMVSTEQVSYEPCIPGEGGDIELDWGDYFNPTADDKQKAVMTLQLATVSKIMSQQSAAEELAKMFERNPRVEWARIQEAGEAAEQQLGLAFADEDGSMGGEVVQPGELPEGTEELEPTDPSNQLKLDIGTPAAGGTEVKQGAEYQLGVSAYDKIVKVNEGRVNIGLGPMTRADGSLDPDGHLTITEFAAKRAEAGKALGGEAGKAQARAEGLTEPEPVESPPGGTPPPGAPQPPPGTAEGGSTPLGPSGAA